MTGARYNQPLVKLLAAPSLVKPLVKLLAPPLVNPLVKLLIKPLVKPQVKPLVKPQVKPLAKPLAKPLVKSRIKPLVKPLAVKPHGVNAPPGAPQAALPERLCTPPPLLAGISLRPGSCGSQFRSESRGCARPSTAV